MKLSKEFKIGVFVVTVLLVTFFVINYLRGEDIFNRNITVISRYENVEGLVPSAPVYIRGYKAGTVAEVIYDTKTEDFIVDCSVSKKFKIPVDSKMTIYSTDIMGGKGVRIELGTATDYIKDGGELENDFEKDMLSTLEASIGPLMSSLTATIDSLSITVNNVTAILSEKNRTSIEITLKKLENTLANVESISKSIEKKSPEIEAFLGNLENLSNKLDNILTSADTTMTNISGFSETLNGTEIKDLIISLEELLTKVQDPDGTLGKILVDGKIYNSIDSLINDVDDLVNKIKENPKKYLKISVF